MNIYKKNVLSSMREEFLLLRMSRFVVGHFARGAKGPAHRADDFPRFSPRDAMKIIN